MSSSYIFNQYYIDFIKRLKSSCKEQKDKENAMNILKKIKESYSTMDKTSSEYIDFIKSEISDEKWDAFVEESDWIQKNEELKIFKDITIGQISEVIDDDYLFLHFMTVFWIFRKEIDKETSVKIIKVLQTNENKDILETFDDSTQKVLQRLFYCKDEKIKNGSGIDMNFIEETTLGKLAKEIMQDIDVDKLKKSIDNNGDVLKAIGDPDSGFAEIITSVSQKMANKLSNGELKQENIMSDVMKFASAMPGMLGGHGKSGQKMPDMSGMADMMEMMSSMMGNKGMNNMFKNMAANQKVPKGHQASVNTNALKKMAQAKKMKKKLHERKKQEAMENKNESVSINETNE